MTKNMETLSVRRMIVVGLLGAITVVLGAIPGLGFIPVGPTRATIMHIPVIIGAIMEGPLVGGLIGLLFGLFSIFQAVTNPTPVSFVFLNPIVSLVPRILIGIVTYYSYKFFKGLGKKKSIWLLNIIWLIMLAYLFYGIYIGIMDSANMRALLANILLMVFTIGIGIYANKKMKDRAIDTVISTALGTLTNTIGVLSAIYIIYAEQFVEKMGQSAEMAKNIIFGIGVANGIPETVIAIIIVTNVVAALSRKE